MSNMLNCVEKNPKHMHIRHSRQQVSKKAVKKKLPIKPNIVYCDWVR